MNLLLLICCANCAIYPIQQLEKREENKEFFGFFFNPNIHPYQEYQKRLQAVKEFAAGKNLRMIYRDEYNLEEFFQNVVFRESQRCRYCYYSRLLATAQVAKKGKFDYFSTTLLYSKQQEHELVKAIAEGLARKCGVKFFYQDFRAGWKEGIRISKNMGLYRQQYCGCIYSEKERYLKKGRAILS